jgi:hypothetical protein
MIKIGDKVAVYGFDHTGMLHDGLKCVVESIATNGVAKINFLNIFYFFIHSKQCRKLVKKSVANSININDTVIYKDMKLVVVDVSGEMITAATLDEVTEPTYYTDHVNLFIKIK